MLQTIADDLWRQPSLAYHVQPVLSPETLRGLTGLQRNLAEFWPTPLNLTPPEALHVTIYALVPVKGAFEKEAYWARIAGPIRDLLMGLCSGYGAMNLCFSRVKVTNSATVALAEDESGLIEAARRRIAETIPPPPGSEPLRYDFIHTTLARYRTAVPVPEAAIRAAESLPFAIPARVETIRLVRETLYPCIATDEIASFPLARVSPGGTGLGKGLP
ncbi:2'-5' RNA ligase family protein [Microvirga roseola]|uniref:2'-5' RNA ligase family protein n=1 Tax=Microvirga roseola TaxID=2883126 RepID=UPI001E4CD1CE|nr:2'-5' RNA ligase family protein [Microvirga roseola]